MIHPWSQGKLSQKVQNKMIRAKCCALQAGFQAVSLNLLVGRT